MRLKKNICITINSLARGGAEKQCILLAQALNEYHEVTLVILSPKVIYQPRLSLLKQEQINHVFLSKNILIRSIQLIRFFKKEQIDFIFSFLPTDTVFSAICGRIAGVPHIFGGIRSSFLPKMKFLILKAINNRLLDYTISNNFSAQKSAVALGFNQNIFVIPNGIEIRELNQKKTKKNISIISLGRLVEAKRYDIAIKTIAQLKEKIGDARTFSYSIVGQGPLEDEIRQCITKYKVQKEVHLITDATEMYPLLDKADIYLCTSSFEGISNALMEAMNCALPIVATDVGDNERLVIDQTNGFLVTVNDCENLANNLFRLFESESLRSKMGTASYSHLIENFSYHSFQKKYLQIIANPEGIESKNGELVLY